MNTSTTAPTIEVPVSWLLKQSGIEMEKIKKSKFSALMGFFMSKDEKDKIIESCAESLGRMKMIQDLLDEFYNKK